MKLEDMPTREHDALFGNCNDRSLGDELCMIYILAHSLEQRLALAVAALKDIRTADDDCVCDSGYSANTVAIETIAQLRTPD